MTVFKGAIYSTHVSADNVMLSVRTSSGEFVSDGNLSPDDAEGLARLLIKAARDARKIKP